jgi:hypothetical protein
MKYNAERHDFKVSNLRSGWGDKIEADSIEEEPKEQKVVITDEERIERFKRLHTMTE